MERANTVNHVIEARKARMASFPASEVSAENGTSMSVAFRPSGCLAASASSIPFDHGVGRNPPAVRNAMNPLAIPTSIRKDVHTLEPQSKLPGQVSPGRFSESS